MECVTIVIISRERPDKLARTVDRYSRHGVPVVVVDGSRVPLSVRAMGASVRYFHRPGQSACMRILAGIQAVSTAALVLAADDDRMSVQVVRRCAALLGERPGLVRAAGTTIHVGVADRDLRSAGPDLGVERVMDLGGYACPLDRYRDTYEVNPQVFYAVIRREVAEAVAMTISDIPDDGSLLAEQLWVHLPSLFGSTGLLDAVQGMRRVPRRPPDYDKLRSSFDHLRVLEQWSGYPVLARRIDRLVGPAGLNQEQGLLLKSSIVERNWVIRPPIRPVASSPVSRALGAVRRGARYAWTPSALWNYSERVMVNRRACRRLSRCLNYPWSDPLAAERIAREFEVP